MPVRIGPLELTIILVIVILLFGVGRVSKIAGELGSAIREFRKGVKSTTEEEKKEDQSQQPPQQPQQ